MSPKTTQFYEFANFRLDPSQKVLLCNGHPVPLTPKVFDTLEFLVENNGQLVSKDELIHKIWADSFVEESNLTTNIKTLRRALGDDVTHPQFIETVPRRGYRFIAKVKEISPESDSDRQVKSFHATPERNSADLPFLKRFLLPILIVVIAVLAVTGFWYARIRKSEASAPILSAPFAAEKLSTTGKVGHAEISPDGKNLVYANGLGSDKQSVWLRQLETSNNVEIIPPSDDVYYGFAFSPDGNFLYFNRRPKSVKQQDIYRVSIFGGIPQKIINDTEGWMSISPDGTRISFVRCPRRSEEHCSLWLADAINGKNEEKLVSRSFPIRIGDNRISPDGKSVAFAVGQSRNWSNEFGLAEIDINSRTEHELTKERFFNIKGLAWLPDQSGLLFTASQVPNRTFRIWQLSKTSGEVKPLTKDSETYSELSLDNQGRRLICTKIKQDFHLIVWNQGNPADMRVLADATHAIFAPNGKIIFSSPMTGNDEIWSINPDGSGQQQLTNDSADEGIPVVSSDNKWIFYTSSRTGQAHIWRMNADGGNQVQITNQEGGYPLFVSPDGNWLYYLSAIERKLRRVSTAQSGKEELVIDQSVGCDRCNAFSPDGMQFADFEQNGAMKIISIISLSDGRKIRSFPIEDDKAAAIDMAWSADGKNLVYVLADNNFGKNTVWVQPIDGGKPHKIADLGQEEVYSFALAPDGKSFAVVQGGWRHDSVLIEGLK